MYIIIYCIVLFLPWVIYGLTVCVCEEVNVKLCSYLTFYNVNSFKSSIHDVQTAGFAVLDG